MKEILGVALRSKRDKALIATKFSPANGPKEKMVAACEGSLKRLRTDVIDLYQMHWPNPVIAAEETAAGFEQLVKSGKVRAVGFSNATTALMQKIIALLPSGFPIASTQQEYNLVERFVERAILPFCQSHHMSLLAYSPLANGRLFQDKMGTKLAEIASKYGTTAATLALQWLAHQAMIIPIPMTFKISHLEGNVKALTSAPATGAIEDLARAFSMTVADLPIEAITSISSHTGKAYTNLADARMNSLQFIAKPSRTSARIG